MVTLDIDAEGYHPAVRTLSWIAVFGVCANHLTINQLKAPYFDGSYSFQDAAVASISLIFVASGFRIHSAWQSLVRQRPPFSPSAMALIVLTSVSLLLPITLLAVSCDLVVGPFPLSAQLKIVERAVPYFSTLTQNWVYQTNGSAVLYFSFASSNIAWIAGTFFFLVLLYSLLAGWICRIRSVGANMMALVILVLFSYSYAALIGVHAQSISAFASAHYGPLSTAKPNTNSLLYWLSEFSPLSKIAEFLAGVFLCNLLGCEGIQLPNRIHYRIGVVLLLVGGLIYASCHYDIWSEGGKILSYLLISIGLIILAEKSSRSRLISGFIAIPLVRLLTASAFTLWMWHLFWYNAYPMPTANFASTGQRVLALARIIFLTLFVVGTAAGLTACVQLPIARWFRGRLLRS